jgi:hypothetical protein
MNKLYKKLWVFNQKFIKVSWTPPFSSYIADEAFKTICKNSEKKWNITVWDPHCWEWVLTRTVSHIYKKELDSIFFSDINNECVEATSKNLGIVKSELWWISNIYWFQQDILLWISDDKVKDEEVDILYTDPPYDYIEELLDRNWKHYLPIMLGKHGKIRRKKSQKIVLLHYFLL